MWDFGCVAGSVAFFTFVVAYVYGCDRLSAKGKL
jgi:hypothetical protein